VIEAVGHQPGTLADAVTAVAVEGTIICFGIPDDEVYPLNIEQLMRKNLIMVGGVTRHRRVHLQRGLSMLTKHPWIPAAVITHQYERSQAQVAYEAARRWSTERLKVVLDLS
jgi:L-iditol 2-dehydrogenase